MKWVKRRLRDQVVYAQAKDDGELLVGADGRVEIRYSPNGDAKAYRAGARNLLPTGEADAPVALAPRRDAAVAAPANAYVAYTDGACTGNPGPMGIGVVVMDGEHRREVSTFLGHGTNNIAELTAIETALDVIRGDEDWDPDRPVCLYTDSSYAIGVLQKNWKAKANQELIARIREKLATFPDVRLMYVPGHAGVPENERCDELARSAIVRRR